MRLIVTVAVFAVGIALIGAEPAAKQEETGSIGGQVRFTGAVPEAKRIQTTDGGQIEHRDLVVDAKTKGLRHVVVVVEDAPTQPKATKADPAVMDQRDMVFLPRVIAVQHGQPVRFENSDLCNHSVMASSLVPANQLNVIATPGQPVTHFFEPQKLPVIIGCSLHSWMRAYVFVVPHPWFAVSDDKGGFTIPKVPVGKYKLTLVHPDTNLRESRMIEVKADQKTELLVEWDKTPK